MEPRKDKRQAERQRKQYNRMKRIKLEKAAPDLLTACKTFVAGWTHFCKCIDFGRSNLDAEAIRWMNETPGNIGTAVTKAEPVKQG